MMRLSNLLKSGDSVHRAALDAALAAIESDAPDLGARRQIKTLARRRDTILYFLANATPEAPHGFLIKLPLSARRGRDWDAVDEATRLESLSSRSQGSTRCTVIRALAASNDPTYLVLPFYPSVTLRNVLLANEKRGCNGVSADAISTCREVGRWLGALYRHSPTTVIDRNEEFCRERLDEIARLGRFDGRGRLIVEQIRDRVTNYGACLAGPQWCHGDFSTDNVLIGDDGVVIIDPEPRTRDPYSDFFRFRRSLVLY
jgi:hypothetical protein